VPVGLRDDPGGEDAGALARDGVRVGIRVGVFSPRARLGRQRQDRHGGVVVVDHLALGGLPNPFVEGRLEDGGRLGHHLSLCRGGQRNLHVGLQPFEPMKRGAHTVLQQRDHARRRGVIFLGAHSRQRIRRKHLAAQVAPQVTG